MDATLKMLMKSKLHDMSHIYSANEKDIGNTEKENHNKKDDKHFPNSKATRPKCDESKLERDKNMERFRMKYETCIDSGLSLITTERDKPMVIIKSTINEPLHRWRDTLSSFNASNSQTLFQEVNSSQTDLVKTCMSNYECRNKRKVLGQKGPPNHPLTSLRTKKLGRSIRKTIRSDSVLYNLKRNDKSESESSLTDEINRRHALDMVHIRFTNLLTDKEQLYTVSANSPRLRNGKMNENDTSRQPEEKAVSLSTLKSKGSKISSTSSKSSGKRRKKASQTSNNCLAIDLDGEIRDYNYNTRFLRSRLTVDSVIKRYKMSGKQRGVFSRRLKKPTSKSSISQTSLNSKRSKPQSKISVYYCSSQSPNSRNSNISASNKTKINMDYLLDLKDDVDDLLLKTDSFYSKAKQNNQKISSETVLSNMSTSSTETDSPLKKKAEKNGIKVYKKAILTDGGPLRKEGPRFKDRRNDAQTPKLDQLTKSASNLSTSVYLDSLDVEFSSSHNSSEDKRMHKESHRRPKKNNTTKKENIDV